MLTTKETARVLSTPKRLEEPGNTYSSWAPCTNSPIELILARSAGLGQDPQYGVRACGTSGENGGVLEEAEGEGTVAEISAQGAVTLKHSVLCQSMKSSVRLGAADEHARSERWDVLPMENTSPEHPIHRTLLGEFIRDMEMSLLFVSNPRFPVILPEARGRPRELIQTLACALETFDHYEMMGASI